MTASCPAPPTPISVTGSSHRTLAIISLASLATTSGLCLSLVLFHIIRYSVPKEQRQIVKISLTPVVIALISFCTLLSYNVGQYIGLIGDVYEAFALAALFLLFVQFGVPDGTFGEELFDSMAKAATVASKEGRTLAKKRWVAVFQYVIVSPIVLLIADVALATNDYCEGSLNPRYANLWVTIIKSLSTFVAVFAVLKLYTSTKALMKPHRAFSKLLFFKVIIGLNILQTWIFKALLQGNVIKASDSLSYGDWLYGVPATLTSVESVLFSLGFYYAYNPGEYGKKTKAMGFFAALVDSANPTDLLKGVVRAFRLASRRSDDVNEDYRLADPSSTRSSEPSLFSPGEDKYWQPTQESVRTNLLASPPKPVYPRSPSPLFEETVDWQQGGREFLATDDIRTRDRSLSESRNLMSRSPSPSPSPRPAPTPASSLWRDRTEAVDLA